jgi:hypothetical protein
MIETRYGIIDLERFIRTTKVRCKIEQKPSLPQYEGARILLSASDYVRRIMKYGDISECCIFVAAIYIDRLNAAGHTVHLSSTTMQRLLLVAVLIAAKFLEDIFFSNKWW